MLVQASTASLAATAAATMVQKVQTELKSGTDAAVGIQTLQTMSPTAQDVSMAQRNALSSGGLAAVATPTGSLTVATSSTVSIVDQMNLIGTNAIALKTSVCTASAAVVF